MRNRHLKVRLTGCVRAASRKCSFNGRIHSFTAHVYITQLDLKAVIIGVVTDGWLKGNLVEGEYTQIQCPHDNITTDCFQGTLDILRGTEH